MKDEKEVVVHAERHLLNVSQSDAILNSKTLWF